VPPDELETTLLRRFDALCDAIRRYPPPIARCDEQLAALLEQRAQVLAQRDALEVSAPGGSPLNLWINDGGTNAA